MRRRPVAVYRVIDEAELLGPEDVELVGGELHFAPSRERVTGEVAHVPPWRHVLAGGGGWLPTLLAVAALGGVAVLLLSTSAHVRGPVAVRAPLPLPATTLRPRVIAAVVAVRRRPPVRRMASVVRHQAPRTVARRSRRRAALRAPRRSPAQRTQPPHFATPVARPAEAAPAPRADARAVMLARPAPDGEFGFER